LVVFDNHIIIFSDKDCEFPNIEDIELAWKRWYKKAVKKSADQIYGAERWILKYPDRLFLDQTCKIPFPINLPSTERTKVHRILVAHSASTKCAEILGGSGSLMIDTEIVGDAQPFTIGKVEQSKGYIHLLDDTSLDILLNTLDTIPDFVSYLEKKEQFLTKGVAVFSTGREELLSTYALMIASFQFLSMALKTLPIGTAYAIWTGIGAVGTAILGMYIFNEPRDLTRILCILLIVAGIVGLKLTSAQ
jgi:multidrug transporter EmrE-like cation transporter